MATDEHEKPIRALLGLFTVLARRRLGNCRVADIEEATGLGRTRLQRLAGVWRPHLVCPPIDVVEIRAISAFAAGVLGVDERSVGRWLAGLADGREETSVEAAIRRLAREAVERQVTIADVELPAALAELLKK